MFTDAEKGQTALHIASHRNDLRTVKAIIEFCRHQDKKPSNKKKDDRESLITTILYMEDRSKEIPIKLAEISQQSPKESSVFDFLNQLHKEIDQKAENIQEHLL